MTHSTVGRVKVAGLQPAQVLAGLLGLVFLVFGVAGFLRTGFGDFAGDQHAMVLGFAVNPLHNVIHLAFGVLGLLMATSSGLSRLYGWIVFLSYGAVLLWGLALAGVFANNPVQGLGNPLALNTNDNWLHLGLAAAGLLIAVLPARRKVVVPDEATLDERHFERDESIRDPRAVRDEPETRPMPTQRVDTHRTGSHPGGERIGDERIESMDPTVTHRPVDPAMRPTQPIDPAIAEQHKARHTR
ncbi:DUF4383 domain-containing protein [Saccharothrix syringae]|uniref:DUF4383 domain-containing protein n=1 Tax=Saccharothrix syringae TaxID=103733 RepID=A0A5Q0H7N6_SACSY|nr:DUF4383 domain-containing protein [Saccharothrix syringae]QFZ22258.1 DUF4383 domain-containing protein [Saccharothrix syringae]